MIGRRRQTRVRKRPGGPGDGVLGVDRIKAKMQKREALELEVR